MSTNNYRPARVITLEQYHEARENYLGYCDLCGAERSCCEPDARQYRCEDCGSQSVYGCDEYLAVGNVI
jgi:hypothetical protein